MGFESIARGEHEPPTAWRQSEREDLLKAVSNRCRRMLEDFRAFLDRFGHEEQAELAIARILDPLVDAPESGFIQRSWRELSTGDLERFVRAGIVREKLLLSRSPYEMRSQEIGELSLDEFRKRFGGRQIVKGEHGGRNAANQSTPNAPTSRVSVGGS
jgi:hypothetical protein